MVLRRFFQRQLTGCLPAQLIETANKQRLCGSNAVVMRLYAVVMRFLCGCYAAVCSCYAVPMQLLCGCMQLLCGSYAVVMRLYAVVMRFLCGCYAAVCSCYAVPMQLLCGCCAAVCGCFVAVMRWSVIDQIAVFVTLFKLIIGMHPSNSLKSSFIIKYKC